MPALVLAAFFRFNNLSKTYLYGDDAEYATVVSYLVANPLYLGYPELQDAGPTPFVSQPPAMLYLFALVAKLIGNVETAVLGTNATLGVATVLLVYAIGCRIGDKVTGAIGATILAVVPMHVALSRGGFLDLGMTFFMFLSLFLFLVWDAKKTTTWAVLTGVAASLAILSKLPGLLILFPLFAGVGWILLRGATARYFVTMLPRVPIPWERIQRQSILAAAPILLSTTAYISLLWYLNATQNLLLKLNWNVGRVTASTATAPRPWHWYFTDPIFGMPFQFGIALFVLAILGLGFVAWETFAGSRQRAALAAIVAFPLVIAAFFVFSTRKEAFYILPLIPMLALLAAVPFGWVYRYLRGRRLIPRWNQRFAARGEQAGLAIGLMVIVGLLLVGPIQTSYVDSIRTSRGFGYGVKEAALLVETIDPEGGQFGTLLGRYSAHFYNGNPTYDIFADPALIEQRVLRGEIRFIIFDNYLDRPREQELMMDLVARHNGTKLAEYVGDDRLVHVRLYELAPDAANDG